MAMSRSINMHDMRHGPSMQEQQMLMNNYHGSHHYIPQSFQYQQQQAAPPYNHPKRCSQELYFPARGFEQQVPSSSRPIVSGSSRYHSALDLSKSNPPQIPTSYIARPSSGSYDDDLLQQSFMSNPENNMALFRGTTVDHMVASNGSHAIIDTGAKPSVRLSSDDMDDYSVPSTWTKSKVYLPPPMIPESQSQTQVAVPNNYHVVPSVKWNHNNANKLKPHRSYPLKSNHNHHMLSHVRTEPSIHTSNYNTAAAWNRSNYVAYDMQSSQELYPILLQDNPLPPPPPKPIRMETDDDDRPERPDPPRIAPIGGVLNSFPGAHIVRPTAFKPVTPTRNRLRKSKPPPLSAEDASSEDHEISSQSRDSSANVAVVPALVSSEGSSSTSTSVSSSSNGAKSLSTSSTASSCSSVTTSTIAVSNSQHPESSLSNTGSSSSNSTAVAHQMSSSFTQTPSPSDSGICVSDLENMLRDRDVEISQLRETMSRNEIVMNQVHEEKLKGVQKEMETLKSYLQQRLSRQHQRAYKQEQELMLQICCLKQDNETMKKERDLLDADLNSLQTKYSDVENELKSVHDRLAKAQWDRCQKIEEISALKKQICDLKKNSPPIPAASLTNSMYHRQVGVEEEVSPAADNDTSTSTGSSDPSPSPPTKMTHYSRHSVDHGHIHQLKSSTGRSLSHSNLSLQPMQPLLGFKSGNKLSSYQYQPSSNIVSTAYHPTDSRYESASNSRGGGGPRHRQQQQVVTSTTSTAAVPPPGGEGSDRSTLAQNLINKSINKTTKISPIGSSLYIESRESSVSRDTDGHNESPDLGYTSPDAVPSADSSLHRPIKEHNNNLPHKQHLQIMESSSGASKFEDNHPSQILNETNSRRFELSGYRQNLAQSDVKGKRRYLAPAPSQGQGHPDTSSSQTTTRNNNEIMVTSLNELSLSSSDGGHVPAADNQIQTRANLSKELIPNRQSAIYQHITDYKQVPPPVPPLPHSKAVTSSHGSTRTFVENTASGGENQHNHLPGPSSVITTTATSSSSSRQPQTTALPPVHTSAPSVPSLDQMNELKAQIEKQNSQFHSERLKWLDEKEKVVNYQRQLVNYIQVLSKTKKHPDESMLSTLIHDYQ